jgi:hypothetical protein
MKLVRILLAAVVLGAALIVAAGLLIGSDRPPRSFFGMAPQTPLTEEDVRYMEEGGIGMVRWPLAWEGIQPEEEGEYVWSGFDEVVENAARGRIGVLPVLFGTPAWLAGRPTDLPVDDDRQLRSWSRFLRATVSRYGPGGSFWAERGGRGRDSVPVIPIREWQVWNEANFFYFATPASPERYAKLLRAAAAAIRAVDPGAQVVLSGLFGSPPADPPRGMPAIEFLDRLYEVPGAREAFDAAALHAYAADVETLEELTEEMRQTIDEHGDEEKVLHITEVGWGSQSDSDVSFEKGPEGQERELRDAYEYLIDERDELRLGSVYWFTWKDLFGACDFCDSAGLFAEGAGFEPKPAWDAFVEVAGGRAAP